MESDLESRLQKNIEEWSKSDPRHATTLQFLDTEEYTFTKTAKGERNLEKEGVPLHDPAGALDQAKKWFASLNLQPFRLIYFYGVGLGYAYLAAKEWLAKNPNHHLVFLEDDLGVIHKLFETEIAEEMLANPQVQIVFSSHAHQFHDPLKVLFWTFLGTPFTVQTFHPSARFEELKHQLVFEASINNAILDEYYKFGIVFYRNFYHNLLRLSGCLLGNNLYGRFEKIPAIICGAGPSLAKHLDALRSLNKRALLFAGGSAFNALDAAGIKPDFGAGIDPNPEQHERYKNHTQAVPFFFRTRLNYQAFDAIQGQKLLLTGAGGYNVAQYFEELLGIEGESLPEGFNVINLLIALAHRLGCDPIITVGMDLGYTGMKSYAPGVVADSSVSKEELQSARDYDKQALLKEDIHGKPFYTLWKWIAESEWIEAFVKEEGLNLYNATEGGLGFGSVPNVTLQEALEGLSPQKFDIASELKRCGVDFSQEKIVDGVKNLRASLERCIALLDTLIEEGEGGRAVLAETELAGEAGFIAVITDFNDMYNMILQGEIRQAHRLASEEKIAAKKLEIQEKKYRFLREAAKANILCIDWALNSI